MPTFRMLCYFEVVIANASIVVMVMLFVIYNLAGTGRAMVAQGPPLPF